MLYFLVYRFSFVALRTQKPVPSYVSEVRPVFSDSSLRDAKKKPFFDVVSGVLTMVTVYVFVDRSIPKEFLLPKAKGSMVCWLKFSKTVFEDLKKLYET